jgi:hypothetical protein
VGFTFSRTPGEAAWDQRVFEAGHALFRALAEKRRDRLGRSNDWVARALSTAAQTFSDALKATGNPAMGVANGLAHDLWRETPRGQRSADGQQAGKLSYEHVRQASRTAAAAMLDMLSLGQGPSTGRPRHPHGESELAVWRRLWWTRNGCLVALAMKEDGTLSELGHPDEDGLSRSLLATAKVLRELAESGLGDDPDVFADAHAAMTALISEIPFAAEKDWRIARITEADAEDALIGASDGLLDLIEKAFPPPLAVTDQMPAAALGMVASAL